MNLIDCYVIKVISKRIFTPPEGIGWDKTYIIFEVEYFDDGVDSAVKELWYEKGTEPDVKEGFVFQH